MQVGLHFFGVALVVEREEAVEHFDTRGLADGEADTLFGFVEAVFQAEIVPAVGVGDGLVHFDVEVTEVANTC